MGDTENGFGKKRDKNQYGEVEKDKGKVKQKTELPKRPNKGANNKSDNS
ncbi:hypothetical protein QRD02_13945 [Aequorivita sp. SDUM287046]|uniref:Uncharacterized protein n=1 Tax=Aequorivita aurantiaca TaxID=3053356 RepID=A0ABT8DKQ3_9FLAO|nr:hypothetical protein [Aequorivita aurantiaca]MDN3725487.1 hypothetical protein [Aequorivita aurantiaca]